MFYVAAISLVCTTFALARAILGIRSLTQLSSVVVADDVGKSFPSVSIVVAARNEEQDIEEAIRSLLAIDYPGVELIVVNDRSTDRTGDLLDNLAAEFADQGADRGRRLRVVHIDELPAGWLGKNNALQVGAEKSRGDYLLFTDADVIFDPSTLRRAIEFAESLELDHVSATPHTDMPGLMLNSFATSFTICFLSYFPPWKAKDPNSATAVGIGAFNLVRRDAYEQVDRHERIRMRPDDDVKLGKILKMAGFRQDVVNGCDMIRVPWYRTVRAAIVGLEKNTFSGVDYSVPTTVVGSSMLFLLAVWPFLALLFTSGVTWYLFMAQCGTLLVYSAWCTRVAGVPLMSALLHPFAMSLIIYIMWRTMFLTFYNNGIYWRDTHYPLSELRANVV